MVIVEGMACGKAVIASAAGGAVEIVRDGVNALAHQPGDAAGLAAQIVRIAKDREIQNRLSEAARRTAVQLCDGSRLSSEMTAVYQSLVAKADDPSSAGGVRINAAGRSHI